MIVIAPHQQSRIGMCEREFVVVWSTLTALVPELEQPGLSVRIQYAADIVLELMRAADCLDPSIRLDGTGAVSRGRSP